MEQSDQFLGTKLNLPTYMPLNKIKRIDMKGMSIQHIEGETFDVSYEDERSGPVKGEYVLVATSLERFFCGYVYGLLPKKGESSTLLLNETTFEALKKWSQAHGDSTPLTVLMGVLNTSLEEDSKKVELLFGKPLTKVTIHDVEKQAPTLCNMFDLEPDFFEPSQPNQTSFSDTPNPRANEKALLYWQRYSHGPLTS